MFKVLFILLCSSFFTLSSQASNKAILNFGVEITDYSPYFFLDQAKDYQGAAREIFDLFAHQRNQTAQYSPLPVPRLFSEFEKGNIDLKFPDNPLWSGSLNTKVKVFYSAPVFKIKETLLVIKQEEGEIEQKNINQVGTILGFSVPGIAQSVANNELETVKAQEIEQLIHMLMSNRVQAVYFNESVALSLSKKMYPKQSLARHSKYPPFEYAYHLSSIKHPEIIQDFNRFLKSHKKQVKDIIDQYGIEQ